MSVDSQNRNLASLLNNKKGEEAYPSMTTQDHHNQTSVTALKNNISSTSGIHKRGKNPTKGGKIHTGDKIDEEDSEVVSRLPQSLSKTQKEGYNLFKQLKKKGHKKGLKSADVLGGTINNLPALHPKDPRAKTSMHFYQNSVNKKKEKRFRAYSRLGGKQSTTRKKSSQKFIKLRSGLGTKRYKSTSRISKVHLRPMGSDSKPKVIDRRSPRKDYQKVINQRGAQKMKDKREAQKMFKMYAGF